MARFGDLVDEGFIAGSLVVSEDGSVISANGAGLVGAVGDSDGELKDLKAALDGMFVDACGGQSSGCGGLVPTFLSDPLYGKLSAHAGDGQLASGADVSITRAKSQAVVAASAGTVSAAGDADSAYNSDSTPITELPCAADASASSGQSLEVSGTRFTVVQRAAAFLFAVAKYRRSGCVRRVSCRVLRGAMVGKRAESPLS